MPIDGIIYKTSNNIETTSKIDEHTYIFVSNNNSEFEVEGLKNSTDYFLTSIEANGEGYSVNYLTTAGDKNTYKTTTPTAPPINFMLMPDKKRRIKAVWEKPEGAINYELDVATDNNFKNKLDKYAAITIGDIDQFIIVGIEKNKYYYVRLRALSNSGYSNYTKIEKIMID